MTTPPAPPSDEPLPAAWRAVLDELTATVQPDPSLLLPLLQQVQARLGHIPPEAMRQVAHALNLSRAEVYGVVSFYHDFREAPVGDVVVQLCMAEACQSVGCRSLAAHAEQQCGVPLGRTTADGRVHLEAAYCFGNCALGPSVRIGEAVHGRVTPETFDTLLREALASGTAPGSPRGATQAAPT